MKNDDKYIPEANEGTLEPNYYCRAWNSKREKYCKNRAGKGTGHQGEGRCRNHGGLSAIKSGRYSKITRPRIAELIKQFEADEDPLALTQEIILLRAMLVDYIERYDEITEALLAWHESFSLNPNAENKPRKTLDIIQAKTLVDSIVKTVDTIIKHESSEAVTMEDMTRLMNQYSLGVQTSIQEKIDDESIRDELVTSIKEKWSTVQL